MKNDLTFTSVSLDEQMAIFGGETSAPASGGFSVSFEKKTTKTGTVYTVSISW
jgi:hypothetical protein